MKALLLTLLSLLVLNCANSKVINEKEYESYGLFSDSDLKNECVHYRIVTGNVIWAIILIEFVVPTVYFVGWSIYEPVRAESCLEVP